MKQKVKDFTKGLLYPFILLLATFVFAMFQGGFVSWFLFYALLPFALYAFVLFFYPLTSFRVERKLMKRDYFSGDTVEVTVTLTRKNRFPLFYLMIEDEIEQPWAYSTASLVFIGMKQSIEWTYLLEDVPRGKHLFKGLRIQSSDVIGLSQKQHRFEAKDTIIVFPALKRIKEFDRLFSGNQGASQRVRNERSAISGVRDYQSGDQLSWINWKATAKSNKIMTNEFEESTRGEQFCLILDLEPSPSLEHLLSSAASFVHFIINRGMEIGYIDSESDLFIPRGKGERQRRLIYNQLAQVKADGQLERSLSKHMGKLSNQTMIAVMTAHITFEKLEMIRSYTKSHAIVCFVVQMEGMVQDVDFMVKDSSIKKGMKVLFLPIEEKSGGRGFGYDS